MKLSIVLAVLLASAVFGADEKKEEKTPMNSSNEVAVIKTSEGEMVVQFWTDAASNTDRQFQETGTPGLLRRDHFPPDRQRIHDPGRRSEFERPGEGEQLR